MRGWTRLAILAVAGVMMGLASFSLIQRELSDEEWCQSFEYREGTREYAECRARIERLRQQGKGQR